MSDARSVKNPRYASDPNVGWRDPSNMGFNRISRAIVIWHTKAEAVRNGYSVRDTRSFVKVRIVEVVDE